MPKFARIVCRVVFAALCVATANPAFGQAPDYDFQWATITDVNNPAYSGGPNGQLAGRGSVAYEYRMSRLELTSAQFMEFVNTFWESEQIPIGQWFLGSSGIEWDVAGPYQLKQDIPNAGMVPVIGLNWRTAAMYCNWLHNGKSSDLASTQSGAYDVSTFHTNPDGTFTDQATRSPGAKFWIPSLDEWLKAAHYDPNRYGPGQGGWWTYSNSSDTALIAGPPGIGQTSGGGFIGTFYVPLGSYADVQSPWGLWDVSGGAGEWTEEVVYSDLGAEWRVMDGRWSGFGNFTPDMDLVWGTNWDRPNGFFGDFGLRVASVVPGPTGLQCLLVVATVATCSGRRRKDAQESRHRGRRSKFEPLGNAESRSDS